MTTAKRIGDPRVKSHAIDDAIDLVGYAISDALKIHEGELSAEFTEADAKQSIAKLLNALTGIQPTAEEIDRSVNY